MNRFIEMLRDKKEDMKFCMWWLDTCKVDKEWDKELNRLMDNHKFEFQSARRLRDPETGLPAVGVLGGVEVWLWNHPYHSFTRHGPLTTEAMPPSKKTIRRAYEKARNDLNEYMFMHNLEQIL